MVFSLTPQLVISMLEKKFGPLTAKRREQVHGLTHCDDIDLLLSDLKFLKSPAELDSHLDYLQGRDVGRRDGLVDAVCILLFDREDEEAERIVDRAFEARTNLELEEILREAKESTVRFHTSFHQRRVSVDNRIRPIFTD